MKRINSSSAQAQQGFKNLSFQLSDVSASFGSGTSAMQIFAQQGGQVVQAIGEITGKAGGFIGFLGGPWGIALTAAGTLLLSLYQKLNSAGDAQKGLTDANRAGVGAADALTEATKALDEITGRTKKSAGEAKVEALFLADARLKQATATSAAVMAEAELLRTRRDAQLLGNEGRGNINAGLAIGQTSARLNGAQAQLARLDAAIAEARKGLAAGYAPGNFAERFQSRFPSFLDRDGVSTTGGRTRSGGGGGAGAKAREIEDPFKSLNKTLSETLSKLNALDGVNGNGSAAAASRKLYGDIGVDTAGDFKSLVDQIDKRKQAEFEANKLVADDEFQRRAESVRTLAGLYEDLFTGGTQRLWQDFKSLGARVIAELLAKFVIAKATGSAFNLGETVTGILGSSGFGGFFVNGGRPPVGKASIVGERGPELFVPDRAGTILPNGALGGQQIVVHVAASEYFDARVERVSVGANAPLIGAVGQAAVTGGAGLARQQAVRSASRRLGR